MSDIESGHSTVIDGLHEGSAAWWTPDTTDGQARREPEPARLVRFCGNRAWLALFNPDHSWKRIRAALTNLRPRLVILEMDYAWEAFLTADSKTQTRKGAASASKDSTSSKPNPYFPASTADMAHEPTNGARDAILCQCPECGATSSKRGKKFRNLAEVRMHYACTHRSLAANPYVNGKMHVSAPDKNGSPPANGSAATSATASPAFEKSNGSSAGKNGSATLQLAGIDSAEIKQFIFQAAREIAEEIVRETLNRINVTAPTKAMAQEPILQRQNEWGEFQISNRLRHVLIRESITTIQQLCRLREVDIRWLSGIGPKGVHEINDLLAFHGEKLTD